MLAKFIKEQILEYNNTLEVITLNKVNTYNIILAKTSYINIATRSKKNANFSIDKILD